MLCPIEIPGFGPCTLNADHDEECVRNPLFSTAEDIDLAPAEVGGVGVNEPASKSHDPMFGYPPAFRWEFDGKPIRFLPLSPDGKNHGLDSFLPGELIDKIREETGIIGLTYDHGIGWGVEVIFGPFTKPHGIVSGLGVTPEDALVEAARDLGRR